LKWGILVKGMRLRTIISNYEFGHGKKLMLVEARKMAGLVQVPGFQIFFQHEAIGRYFILICMLRVNWVYIATRSDPANRRFAVPHHW
jgi:hypothetical protein